MVIQRVPGQPGPGEHRAVLVGGERHRHRIWSMLSQRDTQPVRYLGDVPQLLAGARHDTLGAGTVVAQPHRREAQVTTIYGEFQVYAGQTQSPIHSWLYKLTHL